MKIKRKWSKNQKIEWEKIKKNKTCSGLWILSCAPNAYLYTGSLLRSYFWHGMYLATFSLYISHNLFILCYFFCSIRSHALLWLRNFHRSVFSCLCLFEYVFIYIHIWMWITPFATNGSSSSKLLSPRLLWLWLLQLRLKKKWKLYILVLVSCIY